MKYGYSIDHARRAIIITKEFAKRAANITTKEYRELTSFHRDFPEYTIERRTAEVDKSKKQTYKGLSLAEMENHIKEQDKAKGNSDEGLKKFEAIKAYYTPKGSEKPSYPKVKAWFLKTYPKYGKKDDNTSQPQNTEEVSAKL